MNCNLYALKADKIERSRGQYISPGRSHFRIETGLETVLEILKITKEE